MNSSALTTTLPTDPAIGADGLFSLLPLLLVSALVVVQLLQISFRRDALLCYRLTLFGLSAAFASLFILLDSLPQQATPLLLIDHYALFFMGLILACGILLLPLCHHYWQRHQLPLDEFYLLYGLSILGALVLVCSQHFASFVLGLELLSLPLVAMIGYPFSPRYAPPLEAAIKYLLLSGVASATLLFGVALIYADLGTLSFVPLIQTLSQTGAPLLQDPLLLTGIMLVLAGVGFKLSLVPFHLWTPDVYQGAPTPVTALLATISKAAIAALLLRWYLTSEGYEVPQLVWALTLIAVTSMLVGNLLALLQQNIKRLMAYSSIAHFGYLLVALLALSQSSAPGLTVEAVSYYLVAYLVSTLAVFAVIMQLASESNASDAHPDDNHPNDSHPNESHPDDYHRLDHYRGLFWRRPLLALTLTLALLSLAGIPLTVGFIGKFYLFATAVAEGLWLLLLTLVLASGIGLFYYLRLVLLLTFRVEKEDHISNVSPTQPWHSSSRLTLISLALLTLLLGILPTPLIELIQALATSVG
ncbi:MAG: NADH-quinone oxidoreductase subunit N [Motiliproteus sp.]